MRNGPAAPFRHPSMGRIRMTVKGPSASPADAHTDVEAVGLRATGNRQQIGQ